MTLVLVAQAFLAAAVRAQAGEGGSWARRTATTSRFASLELVRVSTAEVRRLLAALVRWTPPRVRQVLWWSR